MGGSGRKWVGGGGEGRRQGVVINVSCADRFGYSYCGRLIIRFGAGLNRRRRG